MRLRWSTLLLLLLLPVTLVGGIWIGGHPSNLPEPVQQALVDDEVVTFDESLDRIADNYYRSIPRAALADAGVKGMIESLDDRFSAYFDREEYEAYRATTDSRFSGVGLGIQGVKGGLRIVRVYDDSPAASAGLKVGDVVIAADGTSLRGKPEEAATGLIKGREGTEVTLRVRRGAREFTRTMKRATISVPVVASRVVGRGGGKVGVIALASFSSGAHGEVVAAIRSAQKAGAKRFVLDLRGNPGGLVSEARLVASAFLPDGPIVTTRGRNVETRTLDATGDPAAGALPTVVLVNGGSASAAEIVAGALQDRKRAQLVGEKTFGKGVFQEVTSLPNGGGLDITVGQYFTPSGKNLGGRGVARGSGLTPDLAVKDTRATDADEQLDAALRLVRRASR